MNRFRLLALVLTGAIALSFIGLRGARTQSTGLRRVTNTSEEGVNINPSISGDGRVIAFESTEDVAQAGGTDHFRAIRANITPATATLFQMGGARAVAPAISQDGSRIAFASKDDPLGTNSDGNSEIFLFDAAKLIQVTNTSPGDVANRVTNGNFQPSITDDDRFIAFSSNRDLTAQNSDGNLEIFIYDAIAGSFTQLTNSSGIVGASDAKISGDGSSVAYIRDAGATPSAKRDLLKQPRIGTGPVALLAFNVQALAMTYGRAISDDGTRVVYSAETATNSTQVFLFDGRGGAATRQITSLGVRATEVPLHPTISGDGLRIAFATRRSVSGTAGNSDGSVELYLFDIPSSQVSKITDVPSGVAVEVLSSLNDDGSIVAFNFPRGLSDAVSNGDSANNSEIYVTPTPARLPFGAITVLNGAAFGKEPSPNKAVAPDSIAVAIGAALANSTQQPQRLPNGTFPTDVGGTTVMVDGRAAQIFFVSPGQVNFLVPPQTEIGTADVSVTNSENFTSRGAAPILRAAPGVFTRSGDGTGPGVILSSETLQEGPFDPTGGNLPLTIFTTGARNATQNLVVIGGRVIAAESVVVSPDMPGLDEVLVLVPRDLRGAGTVDLFVQSDSRASNPVAITFTGDGTRDILLNEMLSDPPGAAAVDVQGDGNHDGVRSSNDDEFVELVNTTTGDVDLSGYQLLTRSSSTTTDTLRHTFAASTIIPACTAVVVFGGGAFDASNPAFGGSKVVKASSGALSLSNTGGVVTLRDHASGIVTSLSYGGSTGLNGNAGQALTRAPDKTGIFVLHQTASGSGGRSFSPGTQLNGDPFAVCNTFVRIDVSPSSAAIDAGAKQQFTAKAIGANGNEVPNVIFSWQSSDTLVATIAQNGLATSSVAGATEIRASARGTQSAPVTLTVREVPRVLTRVDVTPLSATTPATGAQQFTAKGIDQFGNEITGLAFAWESSNPNAATIDQTGLASGISQGQSTIKATTRSISGTATLNVTVPTIVVNEVLADPPTGADGDANHDGTRDSGDDEFVELVNSTSSPMNISGWTVRTHSTISSTETVRHTFAANTTLPAGEAMVVFGGGTVNPAHPLFGCAQVVKASSGGLSLSNGGFTILVRDGSGNLITQFPYGGSTGLNGGNAQSLTRSPDITGSFVLHTTLAGARKSSPGLKVDGMPFGNCTLLTINDVTLNEGNSGTTTFTFTVSLSTPAPPGGVTFDIATQDSTATVANNDYVARSLTEQTIAAGQQTYSFDVTVNGDVSIEPSEAFFLNVTNVSGALVADGQGVGTILNDDSPILSINDVTANEGNAGTTTFTFTVTSTLAAPAGGITFDIATANGTATAGGDYVARSLTGQTIPAGQTSYMFNVAVNGDTLFEPNETFFVNVTNVSGAGVSDSQGVGTIQNDDTALVDISQLYAGGGNSGATYKNDFIEVFNRGNTTVDLTGWSVQYTSAAGTGTWSVTPLCAPGPCLLPPGHYFLVQEDQGAGGTTNLPTPDAIGTISMTTGAGKVALSASTTPLSGACPSSTSILDVVGYGSSATCFEGTGPAAAPGNATSVLRKSGGCTDTNDNAADTFVSGPSPRNSAAAVNDCNAPPTLTSVTITPLLATIGVGYTQQFMGQALDQFGQAIGGVTVSFASNDANIATVDSASPTSGTGSATATVNGRGTGSAEIQASATNGSTNVTGSAATLTVEPAAGQVLISEFRTRGPAGAADEFIEIYNPTASPVVIGGLKIRASTATGTPSDRVTITAGTILGPGCHYLVANNTAGTGYSGATPPDRTYTTAIADNGGIAITRSDNTVLDAVGMNVTSAYQEGTVLNPMTGSANQSYERKPGGASGNGTETNNNANDFVLNAASSNPQNFSSGCLATNTADVAIAETDSPDPVTVGSDITYSIIATNNGIGTAQSVVITDNLPPGLTYVSCSSTGGGVCGGTGNSRSINFPSLAVGSVATITLVATVNGTGGAIISNTASVSAVTTDSNSINNSATTTTAVSPADLSITKLDSPDPVNAGENITYTLVVTNNSSTIPSQSVTVTDQVPANTTFVSSGATPAGWTRTDATAVGQTGTITFTRSTLPANGNATFTITVRVDSSTANNSNISNTATVSSNTPDENSVNNSATQTTTVRTPADLSINKTVNNASPNVGEQVTFTITVSNGGPYAATGVSVKDQIPAGLTYISDDGAGFYVDSTGIWTVGTVNASATATLHITAQITPTAVNGATNTAELVASDQFDPDSTPNNHNNGEDDQASASVTAQSANLSLSKTVDNSSPNVGQDVTFTITLNNAGPNAATNVQVKDLLPAGLTFVSSTQSQGSYISSSGIWTVGTVNASGSATLTITATVPSAGLITNIAEVTACDVFDPNSTPNNHNTGEDDQAGRTISSLQADLSLLKSADNPAPNVGGNVIFTIAVTNVGPSAATNVQVKDLLPTGLTYVSDDGGGAYASGTGIWTVGTVNASATRTLHITATATSASVKDVTNTAEVIASDVPDPDSTPNNQNPSEDDQKSVTVNAKDADLSLAKTVNNTAPNVGDNVIFAVRISNGGSDAATGVQVTDLLPSGLVFVNASPSQGTYDGNTGLWNVGTVSVGSNTATLTITATVSTSGAKTNTAEIIASGVFDPDSTANDHNAGQDDQSSVTITPQQVADLSLAKTVDKSTPNIGESVIFTIKISNAGPSAATGVKVKDLLPAGLQFASSTPSQGSYVSSTGIWTIGTASVGSDVATLTITATMLTTGAKTNTAEVTASDMPDPDSTPNNSVAAEDDQASVAVTGAANLVINEIVTSPPSSSPPADANDFVEIFNKSGASIDVSGLIMSYRAGALTTASTFTLPGAVGSATTVIGANSYLIIVNGTSAYGTLADLNASASGFDLTAASGGIKIELRGVKVDGLAYRNSASNTISATFAVFAEGTAFTSPVTSGLQDYIRSPNGADTNDNATDFRRNGTATNVTPKGSNPTIP